MARGGSGWNTNMLSRLYSMTLVGIEAIGCEIEVDVTSKGLPSVSVVGLPDTAVKESVERIRSALANCGYTFPRHRTVVNLAPADLKKEGPALWGLIYGSMNECSSRVPKRNFWCQ